MTAYYNENDPVAAEWLQTLILFGQIAPGDVDTRSIKEVHPDDLRGYTQCHFFAGIGGWSYAARLAGWPDDRPLWSGSCPCQPFSVAGQGAGVDDPRHLWPDFFRLIQACRPPVVVGEQVSGAAGYGWLDGVRADLAGEGYTSGAVDIPACAVDAPHIRARLYWVAMADTQGQQRGTGLRQGGSIGYGLEFANGDGAVAIPLADSLGHGGRADIARRGSEERTAARGVDGAGITLGDAERPRLEGLRLDGDRSEGRQGQDRSDTAADDADRPNGSWWRGADWIVCHDGKARRVADARAPLLAHGVSGGVAISRPVDFSGEGFEGEGERQVSRIAAWKGFGNAIVPALAAEVLGALMETT